MLRASAGDALYLFAIYILGGFFFKDFFWIRALSFRMCAFTISLGVLFAIGIEYKGLYLLSKWSYAKAMPTVFGLGISPLAELAVTGLATFFIVGFLARLSDGE